MLGLTLTLACGILSGTGRCSEASQISGFATASLYELPRPHHFALFVSDGRLVYEGKNNVEGASINIPKCNSQKDKKSFFKTQNVRPQIERNVDIGIDGCPLIRPYNVSWYLHGYSSRLHLDFRLFNESVTQEHLGCYALDYGRAFSPIRQLKDHLTVNTFPFRTMRQRVASSVNINLLTRKYGHERTEGHSFWIKMNALLFNKNIWSGSFQRQFCGFGALFSRVGGKPCRAEVLPSYFRSRLRGHMHIASDSDKLMVESSYERSRDSGNNGEKRDYYRRCIAGIVLFLVGLICAYRSVRQIEFLDLPWLLAGLALGELGMFIWLCGWPWTWAWVSALYGA